MSLLWYQEARGFKRGIGHEGKGPSECTSYFSIAMIKCHDQKASRKKEVILILVLEGKGLSSEESM